LATPHDSLFRAVFGDLDNARSLLQANLPAALVAAVDWSTLQRVPVDFFDEDLRKRDADLLFAVQFRGRVLLLHVVVEHKSGADRWVVLQTAGYVIRVLERWHHVHAREPLPLVLSVVVHHGDRPWSAPVRLSELFDFGDLEPELVALLRQYLPELAVVLDDLAALGEARLRARAGPAAAVLTLLFLQFVRAQTPEVALPLLLAWRDLLRRIQQEPAGLQRSKMLTWYLIDQVKPDDEALRRQLTEAAGPIAGENAMTSYEELMSRAEARGVARGVAMGEAKGEARGEAKGEQTVLLRLLTRRFGPLPADVEARVRQADTARLELWADRVLEARTLDEVLAE